MFCQGFSCPKSAVLLSFWEDVSASCLTLSDRKELGRSCKARWEPVAGCPLSCTSYTIVFWYDQEGSCTSWYSRPADDSLGIVWEFSSFQVRPFLTCMAELEGFLEKGESCSTSLKKLQNHRLVGVEGLSGDHQTSARAASPRAICTGLCPGMFWISAEKKAPQPLCAACYRALSPSVKKFFLVWMDPWGKLLAAGSSWTLHCSSHHSELWNKV